MNIRPVRRPVCRPLWWPWLLLAAALLGAAAWAAPPTIPSQAEVLASMRKAGDGMPVLPPNRDWGDGTINVGYFKLFEATQDPKDFLRSRAACDEVSWCANLGVYSKHADPLCPQTAFLLHYQVQPAEYKKACTLEFSKQRLTEPDSVLGYVDLMFMNLPNLALMGKIENDPRYYDTAMRFWCHRYSGWDPEDKLWANASPKSASRRRTVNGVKAYWSRAAGWVCAANVLVLDALPEDSPYAPVIRANVAEYCEGLKRCQSEQGFWYACLLDPKVAPDPESSGTGFHTYMIAWAINHGVVDRATYEPVVAKAWQWMATEAMQPDGRIGWSQGASAGDFAGVGYKGSPKSFGYAQASFLMAGSEVVKMAADYTAPEPCKLPEPEAIPVPEDGVCVRDFTVNDPANRWAWNPRKGFAKGVSLYGDRAYMPAPFLVDALPAELAGGDWIMTANASRGFPNKPLASFTLTRDADVYMAMPDQRVVPQWLIDGGWTRIGPTLSANRITFVIYHKRVKADEALILGNLRQRASDITSNPRQTMYTVILKPVEAPAKAE